MGAYNLEAPINRIRYGLPVISLPKRRKCSENAPIVVWFRVDLRVVDNSALDAALRLRELRERKIFGLFVWCEKEQRIHGIAECKLSLMKYALVSLREELRRLRVQLAIVEESEPQNVPTAVLQFCNTTGSSHLFLNRQYEHDESRRDELTLNACEEQLGMYTEAFHDQCVIAPLQCKTGKGTPFQVFTPFKKCWISELEKDAKILKSFVGLTDLRVAKEQQAPCEEPGFEFTAALDDSQLLASIDEVFLRSDWCTTERQVLERASSFVSYSVSNYDQDRNFPSISKGTSRLSPYLAIGMLSARFLIGLALKYSDKSSISTAPAGIEAWISELCWRDFYKNILVAFPHVCQNKPFKLCTERISWSTDEKKFLAWCQGKTGFPIVDAGMRQLNETGWMHNRLRMIVAMFLSKHLLIHWQSGEKYFTERLIDCDFASNNGGWQWSASTGTDAQPYFRIFAPALQSRRYDPCGQFIRSWVPELASVKSNKEIHEPYSFPESSLIAKSTGYPAPIVSHKEAREKAIAAFRSVFSSPE